MQLEEEKVPQAPAGAHSDRVQVRRRRRGRQRVRGAPAPLLSPVSSSPPQAIVMSKDGSIAVSGSADREIKVRPAPAPPPPAAPPALTARVLPPCAPQVWDLAQGTESCVLLGHKAPVTALCLAEDNSLLFSGDAGGTLMVWMGGSFDHIVSIIAHMGCAITAIGYCVVVSLPAGCKASHGTIIFTGAADGSLKAWRADTGAPWELQPPSNPRGRPCTPSALKCVQCVTPPPLPPVHAVLLAKDLVPPIIPSGIAPPRAAALSNAVTAVSAAAAAVAEAHAAAALVSSLPLAPSKAPVETGVFASQVQVRPPV